MGKQLIIMYVHNPVVLSADEFEKLAREVRARLIAASGGLDAPQVSDRILVRMLYDNMPRYREIRRVPADKTLYAFLKKFLRSTGGAHGVRD